MRNRNFLVLLLIIFTCYGCEKEELPETLIIGAWNIKSITAIAGPGNTTGLDFKNGLLTFKEDGSLEFLDPSRLIYKGQWYFEEKVETVNCRNDAEGNQTCDTEWNLTLTLIAERTGQPKKSALLTYVIYAGANNFTARLSTIGTGIFLYSFEKIK